MRTSLRVRADAQRIDWIEANHVVLEPFREYGAEHTGWRLRWNRDGQVVCARGKTWREAVDTARGYFLDLAYDKRTREARA